ncbi:2-polyprenyl-6-methoxyphenol hydroxylase [Parasphingorhabdus marina DSM 22363]|uniref:2-polyprenyl-6-methoxyphenol hydroxylase n=1 Tax=Parasphingorhabdus marina DSM 22363 TaxID=1123272 RepID=A0A1N6D0E2_9SPHN|nr:NAD(P)/FAD-dependent oxidoreductase [Parasphingorhabdus marina]SIN64174.1 2-polyprenyl-6-methoxyphenol hydroxylase [Parasphingorhabdus marina DSM 22363]
MTPDNRQIVISGGGPSGLAAALLFADLGWEDIVLVERRQSPGDFEKNKAFNYQIDPRGQKLLKRLEINRMLDEYGVANRGFTLTSIGPDGEASLTSPPIIDPDRETSYWTTRRNFLEMMYRAVAERNDGRIRLLYDHSFQGITLDADEIPRVTISDGNGAKQIFQPDLLLACDGLVSQARQSLAQWPGMAPDYFEMIQYPSASTGLTYKVLNLPACFPVQGKIDAADDHRMTYSIVSRHTNPGDAMALFAFPVTDPGHPRSVNIIRAADHNLWKIDNADDLIAYLQDAFPQLDISEIVSRAEAEDFVKIEAGRFPAPQHARHVHAKIGQGHNVMHCLLIGDAAHAFPPDLGLGVNSALEDLFVLDDILASAGGNLEEVCHTYEKQRLPNNASLTRLVQTVAPYQYNHKPWHFRKWLLMFMIQLGLNRIMPWLIDKPTFQLTQNHDLDFVEIERRQKKSRSTLMLLGAALTAALLFGLVALF